MKILVGRLPALLFLLCFCRVEPILQGAINVQIGHNFVASTLLVDSTAQPPDPDGAVGPNHFVQFIDGRFSVFDKATGSNVLTMTGRAFWTNSGVFLGSLSISGPRIIYDRLSQRWFAAQVDFDPNNMITNRFLLAASATADPTGNWNGVAFLADKDGNFADFPTLGLDANGVYLGANLLDLNETFLGVQVVSLPKADLLQPVPAANNRTASGLMSGNQWGFSPQPAINFDPSNSLGQVIAVVSSGIDFHPHSTLKAFHIEGAGTPFPIFDPAVDINVPEYNVPINPSQPGGIQTLDDGDSRIGAFVYQVGNVLYAVHSTEIDNRAAIRWYRVSADDYSLLESGTISDPDTDLFYPSIAANELGHVVITFNGSSETTLISSYAVVGETFGGITTFGDKILLRAGTATYERLTPDGISPWGRYSTTSADPMIPGHFWTIQEIPTALNIWSTQVTELEVTTVPKLTLIHSGANVALFWPTNAVDFTLEATESLGTGAAWIAVTNSVAVTGTQNTVELPPAAETQFFRLRK